MISLNTHTKYALVTHFCFKSNKCPLIKCTAGTSICFQQGFLRILLFMVVCPNKTLPPLIDFLYLELDRLLGALLKHINQLVIYSTSLSKHRAYSGQRAHQACWQWNLTFDSAGPKSFYQLVAAAPLIFPADLIWTYTAFNENRYFPLPFKPLVHTEFWITKTEIFENAFWDAQFSELCFLCICVK